MAETYRDLGWVTALGDSSKEKSVTWMNFPGIVIFGAAYENEDGEISIPVSTQDLVDAGVELTPDASGMIFAWANFDDLNFENISDVQPRDFEPSVADPELVKAFETGMKEN